MSFFVRYLGNFGIDQLIMGLKLLGLGLRLLILVVSRWWWIIGLLFIRSIILVLLLSRWIILILVGSRINLWILWIVRSWWWPIIVIWLVIIGRVIFACWIILVWILSLIIGRRKSLITCIAPSGIIILIWFSSPIATSKWGWVSSHSCYSNLILILP